MVAVVVRRGGELLWGRRAAGPYAGHWCLPCGYVEWGEEVRAAAVREFAEETGLTVTLGPVLAVLAGLACAAMILLILLRLVSLHMLDALLYRGPRLNWFADIGATLAVAGLARHYHVSLRALSRRSSRSRYS